MSSITTYTQTIPYFYIIQHKLSKKMYAGSKWINGCHPDEFMQSNGYITSSSTIKTIIEQEGLDSFEILRIDTNLDGLSAYDYESLFLQCNDCAISEKWYNMHNNMGIIPGSPKMIIKANQTKLEKNNGKFKSDEEIEKTKRTKLEKWGDQNYNNREQAKCTRYEKYDGKFHSDEALEKQKQSRYKIYGDENYNNREQATCTVQDKFGVDNVMKLQIIQEKGKQTRYEKNDGKYHSDETLNKQKQTWIEKSGYDHPSKRPFLSIIETKKTYGKPLLSRYYPEFKKYYPDLV